jgi:hypothetical protein
MEVSGQFTTRPPYPQGKSPWYPLGRRLGGPQSRYGRGGPTGTRTPDHPARNPALYHWAIPDPRWNQFTPFVSISLKPNQTFSFHQCLGLISGLLPSDFPTKFCTSFSSLPCMLHSTPIHKVGVLYVSVDTALQCKTKNHYATILFLHNIFAVIQVAYMALLICAIRTQFLCHISRISSASGRYFKWSHCYSSRSCYWTIYKSKLDSLPFTSIL